LGRKVASRACHPQRPCPSCERSRSALVVEAQLDEDLLESAPNLPLHERGPQSERTDARSRGELPLIENRHFCSVAKPTANWPDALAKLGDYARGAIPAVWLIDVPAREVHLHEQPAGDTYVRHRVLRAGEELPVAVAGIKPVAVAELFAVLDVAAL